MSDSARLPDSERGPVDIEQVRSQLAEPQGTVDSTHEQKEVQRAISLVDRLPSTSVREQVRKFTRRDIAEAFVGSILISLPMLVEDGVFDIAEHSVATPAFFGLNAVFVIVMSAGLLYYAGFRKFTVHRPIFGTIPR